MVKMPSTQSVALLLMRILFPKKAIPQPTRQFFS